MLPHTPPPQLIECRLPDSPNLVGTQRNRAHAVGHRWLLVPEDTPQHIKCPARPMASPVLHGLRSTSLEGAQQPRDSPHDHLGQIARPTAEPDRNRPAPLCGPDNRRVAFVNIQKPAEFRQLVRSDGTDDCLRYRPNRQPVILRLHGIRTRPLPSISIFRFAKHHVDSLLGQHSSAALADPRPELLAAMDTLSAVRRATPTTKQMFTLPILGPNRT